MLTRILVIRNLQLKSRISNPTGQFKRWLVRVTFLILTNKTPEAMLPGFYYAMMSAGLYDTLSKHCVCYLHEA